MAVIEKFERKYLIAFETTGIAVVGILFAVTKNPVFIVLCGILLTLLNNMFSATYHTYQTEIFPTRARATGVGFTFSFSRLSSIFTSFLVVAILNHFGASGVFLRLKYHFMAPAYWINDPNGLIFYKGYYHLFYQHFPYGSTWGSMHWGHARSKDLVSWEHLPVALAPSEEYDLDECGGCFSGSAVEHDGVLYLIYTGTIIRGDKVIQSQCLAMSDDGIVFKKYERNPVIPAPPAEGSNDFRDPKVWRHNGKWYMVVGSCKDGKGKALLYSSEDLRNWSYINVLAESDGSLGSMWECPDLFSLGDKHVLMFSPMGMGEKKTIYLIGDMNYDIGRFTWDRMGEVDCGFEYYAPQSFVDPQGRRIIIGWSNAWDWMPWFQSFGPTSENNWCGAMSIPRQISLGSNGYLLFSSIEELKSLRTNHFRLTDLNVHPCQSVIPVHVRGTSIEILVEIQWASEMLDSFGFQLRCSPDGEQKTTLEYTIARQELIFDRTHSDGFSSGVCKMKINQMDQSLKLHIFVDTCCVEVFVNDGEQVMSNNIYPSIEADGIEFFCNGSDIRIVSLDAWNLRSIW
ncbi:sucrose-6-phosphate hydrolase [Fodinisporobacter ferrooxydans]|uniref:Sucrose-6-phosphate hydrolase n=1 Tax=Fodinisporobacter ferrooxydans TaxID=2901836 RepID=A0ABY4CHR3_9BACL|nr:sucrose-6-phosphate hydrolase [Alicyclobacillaceae bacterium MYW30-H2]